MPWKDHLKQLKDGFNAIKSEIQGSSDSPQAPAHQPPPNPPPNHFPNLAPQGQNIYWRPNHAPHAAVTAEWDAKLGNGPDGWGNQELQHYTDQPQNVFFPQENILVLRAIAQSQAPTPEQRYTSARLVSRQPLSRDRGCLVAVIQSPCAQGIWPAFWLLPQEPFAWPTDGEIDIAETWNGDCENHSCLHWGQHHEPEKHRVLGTRIQDMAYRPVRYDLVWDQPGGQAGQGRLMWFIDGRPIMKAAIPEGTRPMRDMTVLLNVAMGGNVCGGQTPADGAYDMVVHAMYAVDEPEYGGWGGFEHAWHNSGVPEGRGY
ncbi:unnamed protein product [Penicillium salamii]|uniref:GH16 domain-containing protein n=1 Tax=Penicillium salamii TaxID=1612424 RepID=A0A9W4JQ90_9EURO|nr:unnamed protein product [Penicillium salamii]CAG8039119.1 unnamed protein product [Penicillium salamii]CAG8052556.1 unnamed protein product [Penicillium salamii]CAG8117122.1 unnamed protein product [Penicillium salamii]CAG8258045.1 unnamed protein product [Penicillium salamii]